MLKSRLFFSFSPCYVVLGNWVIILYYCHFIHLQFMSLACHSHLLLSPSLKSGIGLTPHHNVDDEWELGVQGASFAMEGVRQGPSLHWLEHVERQEVCLISIVTHGWGSVGL